MRWRSRFALAFEPLAEQESRAVFAVLWRLFGEYGLPARILSDNGSCFAGSRNQNGACHGPGRLEVKLWLLGIDTPHGRPYHPQTQDKVERFHRTMGEEAGSRGVSLRAPDMQSARERYAPLIEIYNWVRPHQELEMKTPGEVYQVSPRSRPHIVPAHELEEEAVKRKVRAGGKVSWRGQSLQVGKGLAHEWVKVQEQEHEWLFCFANKVVARLAKDNLKV